MTKAARSILLLCALVVLTVTATHAQTGTSRIAGTVVDQTGAVVPGATVTATNEATGVT